MASLFASVRGLTFTGAFGMGGGRGKVVGGATLFWKSIKGGCHILRRLLRGGGDG